jgi:ABC-type antimicrobial peptide transport system permease subunit
MGTSPEEVLAVAETVGNSLVRVRETHLASELVAQRLDRPVITAGWGALLVLLFLAMVVAAGSGVMLYSFLDTWERQTEFALLRTLGSSKRQLNGVVWFNLFLVVICGIGLGSLAGQLLVGGIGIPSWSEPPLDKFNILHLMELALDMFNILPLMEVAEEGVPVTPPMALRTNWVTLLVSYLFLAGVTAGTVVGLAWFTARMEVQQVLRIGDA